MENDCQWAHRPPLTQRRSVLRFPTDTPYHGAVSSDTFTIDGGSSYTAPAARVALPVATLNPKPHRCRAFLSALVAHMPNTVEHRLPPGKLRCK
jgi:hypothetical protein